MTHHKTKPSVDPMQRSIFDSGARARRRDPDTSKNAAASVRNMRASHARVLAMFKLYGDMTDETLAKYLNEAEREVGLKLMSPSGVRSRRSELSKPNMDRLDAIARARFPLATFALLTEPHQNAAREQLRREGFRGIDGQPTTRDTLWDTGKRETLDSGRSAIVWGIAR